jgi:hypothetical protein
MHHLIDTSGSLRRIVANALTFRSALLRYPCAVLLFPLRAQFVI